MSLPSSLYNPLRIASALSPVLFSLGDPDLLVEVLNSNPAGVVLVEASRELPVVYCNDSFRRWAPLGGQPIVGRALPELFVWSDRRALRSTYREVINSGVPVHRQAVAYHRRPGDHEASGYWSVSHYPLRGPGGRVTHVLSVTVDVTDQTVSHTQMQETQARVLSTLTRIARHFAATGPTPRFFDELSAIVAELVSAERVAFWLYDADAGTISPQPGAFGFTAQELERLSSVPCHRDGDGVVERIVFNDLLVRSAVGAGDPRAAGYQALIHALGVSDTIAIPWRAGDLRLGALGAYDSTRPSGFTEEDVWVLEAAATASALVWEHRQADDALSEVREREAAGLRHQIEQSIQLEQLKTDFLKLASHELRGPLGIVRGYISMMEDGTFGTVGQSVAPVLPLMRAKLEEMNQLINEIIETARLEDSALELKLVHLDLRDVARAAVHALEPLANERHELVVRLSDEPVKIFGDVSRLRIIVTNLVHNAIKYSPKGGEVQVTCESRDGAAVVSVSDQGVGIAPSDQGRLFTRFGRIVTRDTQGLPGTGLGLFLARDLARRHGGDVTVWSEPGRGSTFTLSLPLAQ